MKQGVQMLPGGLIYHNHQLLYPLITESRWSLFTDFVITDINSGGILLSWFWSSTLYGFFIAYEGDAPALQAGRLSLLMGTNGKRAQRYIVKAGDNFLRAGVRYQVAMQIDLSRSVDEERVQLFVNGEQVPLAYSGQAPREVVNLNLTVNQQQILSGQITGAVYNTQIYNNCPGLSYWKSRWDLKDCDFVPQRYLDGSNGNVYAITTPNAASNGYTASPSVSIVSAGGTGATITANVTNGTITSYTVTAGGAGYSDSDTVVITDPSGGGQGATAWLRTSDGVVTNVYPGKPGQGTGYRPYAIVGAPEANSAGDWFSADANYSVAPQAGGSNSQYCLRIKRTAGGTGSAASPAWCPIRPYNFAQNVRVRGQIRRSVAGPTSVELYLRSSIIWSSHKAVFIEEIGQNWMSFDVILNCITGLVKDSNIGTSYAAFGIRLSPSIAQNEYVEIDNLLIEYEGVVVNLTAEGIQPESFWLDETWNKLNSWQTTGATRMIGYPVDDFSWVWTSSASGFMGQDAPVMMPEGFYRVSIVAKADANTTIQLGRATGGNDIVASTALTAGVLTDLTIASGGRLGGLREVWITYNATPCPVTVWINGSIMP